MPWPNFDVASGRRRGPVAFPDVTSPAFGTPPTAGGQNGQKVVGAVGDGVTDDSKAFQNAITVNEASGGGPIIVPPGTYLIGTALTGIVASVFWVYGATFTGSGASSVAPAHVVDNSGNLAVKSVTALSSGPYSATAAQGTVLASLGFTTYGPSNGSDDTTALNAHLAANAGLFVILQPGQNYKVSAPVIVPSGTTLNLNGSTITELAGTNNNILKNAGSVAQRSVADAAITNGLFVLTSATAAFTSADVGRSVTVAGAGAAGNGPLTAKITVFTNSTTVTLDTAASATVTNAALSMFNRDSNIAVIGGGYNRGNNSGTFQALHSLFFRHVDGLTVDVPNGVTSTAGKFAVSIADCTDIYCRVRELNNFSDGVHLMGPITGAYIEEVHGHTGDDLFAITCDDWPGYNDTCGDVRGVTVGSLYEHNGVANICKFIAGAGCTLDDVIVTGIIQGNSNLNGVWIGDDTSQVTTTGGTYGRIDFGRVDVVPTNTSNFCVYIPAPSAERIKGTVRYSGATALANVVQVTGTSAATIDVLELTLDVTGGVAVGGLIVHNVYNGTIHHLILDACRFACSGILNSQLFSMDGGTIDKLTIVAPQLDGSAGTGRLVWWVNGTLTSVDVIGGSTNNANCVFRRDTTTAGTVNLLMAAHRAFTCSRVVDVRAGTTNVRLGLPDFASMVGGNAPIFTNAGTVVISGEAQTAGTTIAQRNAAESVRSLDPNIPIDVSITTPSAGDMANNTNSAVTPFTTGPCTYDGTNWRPLKGYAASGTAVLVAGSKAVADTKITGTSLIRVYNQTVGGTRGALWTENNAGVGFTIFSTNGADTSTIAYEIERY